MCPISQGTLAFRAVSALTRTLMKAILRSLLIAAACTLFAGCFQIERVVNVKPDGSGTITETVIIPKAIIAQMKAMTDSFGKGLGADGAQPTTPAKSPGEPDEAKLKEQASKMGEGVTFVSAKKAATASGEGFTAIFAFTDISKVKLDQNPSDAVPSPGPGVQVNPKAPPEIITFQFTKAKPSQLIVNMPAFKPGKDAEKKEAKPKADEFPGGEEMAMAMMKEMFKDMRMTLAIEVNGKIVKTDADNVAGNRVTLMDMDFNKLLANPEKFKALSKAEPKGLEEAKALMKGIDGIKFETKPKVSIAFQ
jgi:hypothetical protein